MAAILRTSWNGQCSFFNYALSLRSAGMPLDQIEKKVRSQAHMADHRVSVAARYPFVILMRKPSQCFIPKIWLVHRACEMHLWTDCVTHGVSLEQTERCVTLLNSVKKINRRRERGNYVLNEIPIKGSQTTWCLAEVFSDVTHSAGRWKQGSIVGIA